MIQHKYGNRFSMGEPDGTVTERLQLISGLLHEGGMKAPQKSRLQDESWIKLWGNCSYNPVSAFTGASLDLIGANKACRDVVRRIMLACKTLARKLEQGLRSMSNGGSMGAEIFGHKPSTRQDVEKGRSMDLDALTSTVHELARLLDIPTPTLDSAAALVRMQDSVLGLYNFDNRIEKLIFQREDGDS